MSTEQINADFYYQLGADTQLEAVGEDDLDAHMQAPIFAQLTMESQAYLRDEDFPTTGWDDAETRLESVRRSVVNYAWAVVLGGVLAGIGWLELVSAA